MHRGQFLQPDRSMGDESTVGGYALVHGRPAALEGRNGLSYSVEILSDELEADDVVPAMVVGSAPPRFGAYLIFVQWSRLGAQRVEGHVESAFLAAASSAAEAERLLGAMELRDAQRVLDEILRERHGASTRRWWTASDAAGDASGEGAV